MWTPGVKRLGITYPVAIDNDYTTWNNFTNESWPAEYLVDSTGEIRHVAIGEGDYATMETLIRQLLTAANPSVVLPAATDVADKTPTDANQTPETYLGSERVDALANSATLLPGDQTFSYSSSRAAQQFALNGTWTVSDESLTAKKDATIKLSFSADDVYLDVGGSGTVTATVNGKTSTYQVSGAPDIYTVFSASQQQTATITLALSPGLAAYSFTFG